MRSITTKILPLLMVALPLSAAPSRINPANQIDWTKVSGVGVPTATCNSTFYGMPYTNRTNGDFYVCASTGWVLITGGSGAITVNGSSVSNPNFNDTTPAAGTNGKNIAVQVLGSDVSFQIVGDGVTTHFLNGAGSYTTPAGAGTIGGSGTTNKVAKFTSSTDIGDSDITDDGTTVTSGKPLVVADGSGVAGVVSIAQGTVASNNTTSVTLTAPTSVTSYRLQLPGAHGTSGLTALSCTAADPSVCTWVAPGTGTVTSIATTSPITGGTITTTGTIACATCVTAAASLTSNSIIIGGGSQAVSATTALPSGTTATTQSAADNSTKVATTAYVDGKLRAWSCQPGQGDGLNAIAAGTLLTSTCMNTTGVTVTITGAKCFSDNSGTTTLNVAGNTLGALLTGAITCTSSFASGTQSANVLLTSGDYLKFTYVADGTSKQITGVVTGTY